jgi:gluconokinase
MVSLVIMGVAGCGKSSLGQAAAHALGWPLIEGDDFHPAANVEKMRTGIPLVDADRSGWLALLGAELQRHPGGAVLTCSALKKSYRDQLRAALPGLRFVHLALSIDAARTRVAQRAGGHYFQANLVDSQFATLESPAMEPGVLTLDATQTLAALTPHAVRWTQETPDGPH